MPLVTRSCPNCGTKMQYSPENKAFNIQKTAGKPLCSGCVVWQRDPS